MTRTVMLPIVVPDSKFCFNNNVSGIHCHYLRNTDACTHLYECILGFGWADTEERTDKKTGAIKKPKECLKLKG